MRDVIIEQPQTRDIEAQKNKKQKDENLILLRNK